MNPLPIFIITLFYLFSSSCITHDRPKHEVKESHNETQKTNEDSLIRAEMQRKDEQNKLLKGTLYQSLSLIARKADIAIKDLEAKVVFLNFGFAACQPCILELNGLSEIYTRLKADKDFIFLSFTFDDARTSNKLVKDYGLKYIPISITEKECQELSAGNGYPTNILLDKKGIIKEIYPGGFPSEDESTVFLLQSVLPKIEGLLNKSKL